MLKIRQSATLALPALDAMAIASAFVVAAFLRTHHASIPLLASIPETPLQHTSWLSRDYVLFLLGALVLWPLSNSLNGTYEAGRLHASLTLVTRYITGALLCALLLGFLTFALKLDELSRLFTIYFFGSGFVLLLASRLTLAVITRHGGFGIRRIVLFGESDEANRAARALAASGEGDYQVQGCVAAADCPRPRDLILPPVHEMLAQADEIILITADRGMTEAEQTLITASLLRGKRVHVVPALPPAAGDERVTRLAELGVLSLGGTLEDRLRSFSRRAFDIAGACLLAVVALPLTLLLGVLVKLDSSGPMIFMQQRLGRDGRAFRLYKLRSMVSDAERRLREDAVLHARYAAGNFKLPDTEDPRITRVGRWLRGTGLDELPQLWNVLRGDMSLVGPRPVVPPEIELYGDLAPLLLAVKPGLTGYWQVLPRPAEYPLRAQIDAEYLLGRSLRGDLGILLRTVPTLLRRRLRG